MKKFGGYFDRKGWFGVSSSGGDGDVQISEGEGEMGIGMKGEGRQEGQTVLTHQEEDRIINEGRYGSGTRIVLEVATAYAITKALLPIRIVGSVWATPWFARRVLSVFTRFRR